MSDIVELLKADIAGLEATLAKGEVHQCRFCLWFDCSKNDACKCGCGAVRGERKLWLERVRYLLECITTGEMPDASKYSPATTVESTELREPMADEHTNMDVETIRDGPMA